MNYCIKEFVAFNYAGTSLHGHDNVSSHANNASFTSFVMYKDEYYGGQSKTVQPGVRDADYTNGTPTGNWNDTVDSARFSDEYNTARCKL